MADAADATPALLPHSPTAVEGMDARIVQRLRDVPAAVVPDLPRGEGWLIVELTGDSVAEVRRPGAAACWPTPARWTPSWSPTSAEAAAIWRIREDGAGLAARTSDGRPAHAGWEDAAVPVERLGAYLRGFEALLDEHGLQCVPYGHFGDGCIHGRIDFPFGSGPGPRPGALPGLHRGRRPAGRRARRLDVRRARRRAGPQRAAAAHVLPRRPRAVRAGQGGVRPRRRAQPRRPGAAGAARRRRPHRRRAAEARRAWRWPTGTTAGTSPPPSTGAPAWASAAPTCRPPAVSCARPGGPPARRRTPPAAGRACCRRCSPPADRSGTGARPRCTTPSTSACPARAAPATAPPAWTWPPTRPRCCTSPTGAGCARASHYTLGRLPHVGRPRRPHAPAGQRRARVPARRPAGQVVGRDGPAPRRAPVRPAHLPRSSGPTRPVATWPRTGGRRWRCGWTRSPTTSRRRWRSPPPACSRRPATGCRCRARTPAAG